MYVQGGECRKWYSPGNFPGPIFFLVFVNDLPEVRISYVNLFGDDAKIYTPVKSINDIEILHRKKCYILGLSFGRFISMTRNISTYVHI